VKKSISKNLFRFLQNELRTHCQNGLISDEQMAGILNEYAVESKFNFIRILVLIGSVLVGLGILSFVASNWQYMGNLLRFSLIILLFLGTNLLSFKLKENYPKVSRGLLYLSALIYGAGIFLVGQMFHLGGHFTVAFLLWGIGVIYTAVIFKDKLLYLFAHILFLIYLNGYFSLSETPYYIFLIIPALYYLNKYFGYYVLGTFLTNIIVLNTIVFIGLETLKLDALYVFIVLFAIGLLMLFANIKFNTEVFRLQGSIVTGISGLVLTFKDIWGDVIYKGSSVAPYDSFGTPFLLSVIFAVLFLTFLFFLVKKRNLIALIFICLTIFRFYVDTLIDFMPKSLFFITGGLIILGFGFYFEKMRKQKGGGFYE